MKKKRIIQNVITGFGGQLLTLALGIIVPRLMLVSYGSDVNGLTSTITQIFTYMALLEAGIGQATKNALYKPISENNKEEISFITSASSHYFHRVTVYYGICVLLLSLITPHILNTKVDKGTVFLVVLFEGMSGVITFYYIQTIRSVLIAFGQSYVTNSISFINKIITYAVRIVLVSLGVNIALLQFVYFIITVAQVAFYIIYFRKNYSWINLRSAPKSAKLKDRNSYILAEIAWTVFSSTDMIVLSIFTSTKESSVYAIYNMVFHSLHMLLNAIYSSVNYILGQTFHKDIKEYEKLHDTFNSVFFGCITIMMSVSYLLVIPFVKMYTRGVNDIDYINTSLPLLFCLIYLFSWSRYITGNLTAVAGYAKVTGRVSVVEAMINLCLSVLFVSKYGITGVLAATVFALPVKVICCTYLSDKKILKRSYKNTVKILGVNFLLFFCAVIYKSYVVVAINGVFDFIKFGILYTVVISTIVIVVNLMVNRECLKCLRMIKFGH